MGQTAREVLNRLKWERGPRLARASVLVADRTRPEGGRFLAGSEIVSLGRKSFSTAHATIPFYKILRIAVDDVVLFERT
jgi:uncharacterized protein (UPF0248 family)